MTGSCSTRTAQQFKTMFIPVKITDFDDFEEKEIGGKFEMFCGCGIGILADLGCPCH